MTSPHRKRRGAETQRLVAAAWRADGWPFCEDAGAGRNGADLLNTPGLSVRILEATEPKDRHVDE